MEHRPVKPFEDTMRAALSELSLGGLRVFPTIGSTNDEALAWASAGAVDLSVVVADEQTRGRGRADRKWASPSGRALAFTVIFRDPGRDLSGRLAGLGAMAVADACMAAGLNAAIKWPNDVLVSDRKVGGILVESLWSGDQLEASVIGVGINVFRGSVPPAEELLFPSSSIEEELGRTPDRSTLLRDCLAALLRWRPQLQSQIFLEAWEARLAFVGTEVALTRDGANALTGWVSGLANDGSLRLMTGAGEIQVQAGDLRLRAAGDRMP